MKIGNLDISSFKVGVSDCSIYLGDTLLYPTTQVSLKYTFTLTDDSVVSGECDASSAITSGETSEYQTTLKEAVVGDCVTSIGSSAFYNCSCLTSCTIGNGVTSIGNYTFQGCSGLTSIDIPDSVTSIGSSAFQDCSGLTSCTIGNGVTSIGNGAFQKCSSLTICTIGSGVTSIDGSVFRNCSGLTSITINSITPPALGRSVFYNINNFTIYVPAQSLQAYKAASGWKDYASRIQAIPNS